MLLSAGESSSLSASVIRNGAALSGKAIDVRVIRIADGVEVLAATPVPETAEPGLYAVAWLAPIIPGLYEAIYYMDLKEYAEEVQVTASSGGAGASVEEILTVTVEDDQAIAVAADIGPPAIVIVIPDEEIVVAVIPESETLAVVANDGVTVTVTVEEC